MREPHREGVVSEVNGVQETAAELEGEEGEGEEGGLGAREGGEDEMEEMRERSLPCGGEDEMVEE